MSKTYIAKLTQITNSDGIVCSNPKITFEKPSCANIVCELVKNAQGQTTSIKIQVPDDCEDGCVDVKIDCSAQCSTCGEQRIRICPCTVDSDCPDCSTCGPNGLCITNCKTNEFCSGERCVECDEFTPCTGGKVCESGKCNCPPEKPYQNAKGECVQCNQFTPLTPCEICDNGFILVKDCPAGVLNPDTCDCVECLKSSDCKKPNEKCGPNGCECIDGFRRNAVTGDCEPKDDCTRDSDCGDCRKCKADGKCGDFECPPGFTPSNMPGKCCVKICDCNNPSCPPGHKCVNLDGTKCFCQDCNVKCASGKCPEGCICDKTDDCKPNPCGGKCIDGKPCAPGCGCDQNDNCVPCDNLNCAECEKVIGCDCTTPDNCEASDCTGPCDQNTPCAPGCGCTEKRICENCRKINCLKHSDCPDGCDCKSDNKCGQKDCVNTYCSTPSECGENCDCIKGKCETGFGGGDPNAPCSDVLSIKEEADCAIKGELTTKQCCACKDIYVHVNQTQYDPLSRTVAVTLRTGPNATDTKLSQTGIVGDNSITGNLRLTWVQQAREVNSSNVVIAGGKLITLTKVETVSFSNNDEVAFVNYVAGVGVIITHTDGKKYKIVESALSVESIGLLINTVNKCTYKIGKTIIYRKTTSDVGNSSTILDKVQRCKNPIFTWYKSNDGSAWTQVKKVYAKKVGTKYEDILNEVEGLELCKYFKLSSDCGCGDDVIYSCENGSMARYVPYIPKILNVTQVDPCGKIIEIEEIKVCSLFKPTSLPYKLYINGVLESSYNVDVNGMLFVGGLTITKLVPITEVKLVYPCDDCNNPLIITLPTLSADCFTCTDASITLAATGTCATGIVVNGTMFKVTTPLVAIPGCNIAIYLNGVFKLNAITDALGAFAANLAITSNGTYTVKVTNCYGCEQTDTITINDCCSAAINGIQYNCGTLALTSILSGCAVPGNYLIKRKATGLTVDSGVYSNSITLPFTLSNEIYIIEVGCGAGCDPSAEFTVSCGVPNFTLIPTCTGIQGIITSSAYTGGAGAPWLVEYSTDNFVTILGSSAVDPFSFNSTDGIVYKVRLTDSAGNSIVKTATGLDCLSNSFDFTTVMSCMAGIQKFCFTPTVTGFYTAVAKDVNNVTVFSASVFGAAGVPTCNNFTIAPAAGTGTIELTHNGNTVTHNINITACAIATIAYNCSTGLSVTGVATFNVHSPGYPPAGYGPFASGDPGLFFTDGVSDSRTLTIKSPDGSETYGTVVVNCCTHSSVIQDDVCNGINARLKVSLTGVAGAYRITIFTGASQVCVPTTVNHVGGTVLYSIACDLVSSTTYSVEIVNVDYGNKIYKDQLIGNVTCSTTTNYTSTNCGFTGPGGGGQGCPVQSSDIVITGSCTPSITNNASIAVSVLFKSTEFTNCTGQEFPEGSLVSINPGQTISYGVLGHVNLGKKLFVNSIGPNGDSCVFSMCYTGCVGASSCSLTTDPSPACSTTGAAPGNRRLTTTNTNANAVFLMIDGIDKGIVQPGASNISYYANNTNHTILFKCVDDVAQTRTITYLLNC